LPHDIRASELKHVWPFFQFEFIVPEGELNHDDARIIFGHPLDESVEILTFRFVSRRVEVRRDDTEIGSHEFSVFMPLLADGHTARVLVDVKRVRARVFGFYQL
jgi:hypothetical protein